MTSYELLMVVLTILMVLVAVYNYAQKISKPPCSCNTQRLELIADR